MKKYRSIIFDFDGTLVNSMDVLLRIYSSIKEELDLPDLTAINVEKMRGMGAFQVFNFLSLSYLKLPLYLFKLRSKYKDFVDDISPVQGITYVLIELHKKYPLHILTSNERDIVFSILNKYEINCFETVTSERNVFGKHYALKNAIKQLNYEINEVLYVGDEVRDIEACQKIGLDCCAVSWGLNSFEVLKSKNPKYLLEKPQDLLTFL